MSDRNIWKLAGHDVPEDDGSAPCRLCGRTGAARMLECPKRQPNPPPTDRSV